MNNHKITLYGAHWCPDCRRSKQFLGEHQIPYLWVDIEKDKAGEAYVIQKNGGKRIIPTLEFEDGTILVEPSNAQLAAQLGLKTTAEKNHYDLIVIGGGNSAAEESLFLVNIVDQVSILVRGKKFTASQVLIEKVLSHPKIGVRFNTEAIEFSGSGGKLTAVTIKNTVTSTREEIHPMGVFVYIGQMPNTSFLESSGVLKNQWGFIQTGHDLVHDQIPPRGFEKREPAFLETSIPGIFAAGDVRSGSTKQVASAAGEGATAALLIREYLKTV